MNAAQAWKVAAVGGAVWLLAFGTGLAARAPAPLAGQPAGGRLELARALEAQRFDDALDQARALIAAAPEDAAVWETLTYQLVAAGAPKHAVRLLLEGYPFAFTAAPDRERLLRRLFILLQDDATAASAEQISALRSPLDAPRSRSIQATFWAGRADCDAVRAILGDMSPEYGHDEWMRLGECLTREAPRSAYHAYARAHALQPGGAASRAVGYQAYAVGEYAVALDAWRAVGNAMTDQELLSAVTTALAAGEYEQAASWISRYADGGGLPTFRYWDLLARTHVARGETDRAAAAFERALELEPAADVYLHLAQLTKDIGQRVALLERAGSLHAQNATVAAELGYAYVRAGRPVDARRAFERAAAVDPHDAHVQLALGYLHWDAGRPAMALGHLERAWEEDPANPATAEQLAYVHQRLHQNESARWFARRVLDTLDSRADSAHEESTQLASRRFALQRLHEELGRRVTVTAGAWSGSGVGTGTSASQAGSRYSSYSQLEVEYRLGRQPVRDGTTLAAYARAMGDGGDARKPVPSENPTAGAGLRWKPLRRYVWFLAAEAQSQLQGSTSRELLLRSSSSFFNGGRFSDDWHPNGNGWFAANLYLDAAHYVAGQQTAFTVDLRGSYHAKSGRAQTLEPYGHVQVNGWRMSHVARDVRIGAGSRWNLWYGATRYSAAPHKLSIGVEVQHALETYLPDRRGVFLSISSRW